jgi:hypothetical protein
VSGFCDAIPGGFQPHEAIIRPTNTSAAINRRTPQSYGRSKTRSIKACLVPGWGGYWRYDEILIMADVIGGQRERTNRRYQLDRVALVLCSVVGSVAVRDSNGWPPQ